MYDASQVKDQCGLFSGCPMAVLPESGPGQFRMVGHGGLMAARWLYPDKHLPAEPQRSFNGVE